MWSGDVAVIKKIEILKPREILTEYGRILSGREDIITGGAIILAEIVSMVKVNSLLISSRGIRYGAIISEFLLEN